MDIKNFTTLAFAIAAIAGCGSSGSGEDAENTNKGSTVVTSTAEYSYTENEPFNLQVVAQGSNGIRYALDESGDGAYFSIDSATGVITPSQPLDFENPQDAGGDNSYELQVSISASNATTITTSVAVSVLDAEEYSLTIDYPFDNSVIGGVKKTLRVRGTLLDEEGTAVVLDGQHQLLVNDLAVQDSSVSLGGWTIDLPVGIDTTSIVATFANQTTEIAINNRPQPSFANESLVDDVFYGTPENGSVIYSRQGRDLTSVLTPSEVENMTGAGCDWFSDFFALDSQYWVFLCGTLDADGETSSAAYSYEVSSRQIVKLPSAFIYSASRVAYHNGELIGIPFESSLEDYPSYDLVSIDLDTGVGRGFHAVNHDSASVSVDEIRFDTSMVVISGDFVYAMNSVEAEIVKAPLSQLLSKAGGAMSQAAEFQGLESAQITFTRTSLPTSMVDSVNVAGRSCYMSENNLNCFNIADGSGPFTLADLDSETVWSETAPTLEHSIYDLGGGFIRLLDRVSNGVVDINIETGEYEVVSSGSQARVGKVRGAIGGRYYSDRPDINRLSRINFKDFTIEDLSPDEYLIGEYETPWTTGNFNTDGTKYFLTHWYSSTDTSHSNQRLITEYDINEGRTQTLLSAPEMIQYLDLENADNRFYRVTSLAMIDEKKIIFSSHANVMSSGNGLVNSHTQGVYELDLETKALSTIHQESYEGTSGQEAGHISSVNPDGNLVLMGSMSDGAVEMVNLNSGHKSFLLYPNEPYAGIFEPKVNWETGKAYAMVFSVSEYGGQDWSSYKVGEIDINSGETRIVTSSFPYENLRIFWYDGNYIPEVDAIAVGYNLGFENGVLLIDVESGERVFQPLTEQ